MFLNFKHDFLGKSMWELPQIVGATHVDPSLGVRNNNQVFLETTQCLILLLD